MAKITPRILLDQALSFVLDSKANSKARLFMWKVAQLNAENKLNKDNKVNELNKKNEDF